MPKRPCICPELELIDGLYDVAASLRLYEQMRDGQVWPDNCYGVAGRPMCVAQIADVVGKT